MGTIRQDSWLCSSQLWPYEFICGTRGTGILNPKTKFTNFSAQDENKRVGVKPIRTCFELNHVPHDEMPSFYDCRKNVILVKDSSWKDGREEDPRSDSGCKEPRGMFSACWKRPPEIPCEEAWQPGSRSHPWHERLSTKQVPRWGAKWWWYDDASCCKVRWCSNSWRLSAAPGADGGCLLVCVDEACHFDVLDSWSVLLGFGKDIDWGSPTCWWVDRGVWPRVCMVVLAFCSRLACCTGIIERLLGRGLKKHTSKCVVEQRFAICFDVIFDRCTRPAVLLAICRIEVFAENELIVNITHHELVPKHVPLSDEEKQQLLNRFGYLSKKLEREPDTSWFHQSELQKHEKKNLLCTFHL